MRNTPCVDGCDGPIEIDIFSGSNSFGNFAAAFAPASGNACSVVAILGALTVYGRAFTGGRREGNHEQGTVNGKLHHSGFSDFSFQASSFARGSASLIGSPGVATNGPPAIGAE